MITSFSYTALNSQGRKVYGTIAADGVFSVVDHLRSRELAAVTVVPARPNVARWLRENRNGDLQASLVLFYRSLALLLESGVQLRRALHIVQDEISAPKLHEAIAAIIATIDSGRSLGTAMRMHPSVFPVQAIALIDAGEKSGALADTVARYGDTIAQQRSLMRKIVAAMMYPAFVLTSAFTLVIALLVSILPTLANLFTQMNVPMPAMMQMGVDLSAWWGAGGWLPTMCIVSATFAVAAYAVTKITPQQFDGARLRMPLFGRLFRRTIVARWARLLSTLLSAGVGIVPALETTLPAMRSPIYEAEIERIARALEDGGTIADALRLCRRFEPFVVHLVAVGEETGKLDANLARIADIYERDVAEDLASAVALIEPVVILVVGAIVGVLVISIFVPLYSLIGNIR